LYKNLKDVKLEITRHFSDRQGV